MEKTTNILIENNDSPQKQVDEVIKITKKNHFDIPELSLDEKSLDPLKQVLGIKMEVKTKNESQVKKDGKSNLEKTKV